MPLELGEPAGVPLDRVDVRLPGGRMTNLRPLPPSPLVGQHPVGRRRTSCFLDGRRISGRHVFDCGILVRGRTVDTGRVPGWGSVVIPELELPGLGITPALGLPHRSYLGFVGRRIVSPVRRRVIGRRPISVGGFVHSRRIGASGPRFRDGRPRPGRPLDRGPQLGPRPHQTVAAACLSSARRERQD